MCVEWDDMPSTVRFEIFQYQLCHRHDENDDVDDIGRGKFGCEAIELTAVRVLFVGGSMIGEVGRG